MRLYRPAASRDVSSTPQNFEFATFCIDMASHLRNDGAKGGVIVQRQPQRIVLERVPPLGVIIGAEGFRQLGQSRIALAIEQKIRGSDPARINAAVLGFVDINPLHRGPPQLLRLLSAPLGRQQL
jgi:hypothetical protein